MTKGRFAPSPTGRMHLGNVFAALISWLSAKKNGGKWVLRIEDLDPQRSRLEYAKLLEDDLCWLGLTWDEGGLDDNGPAGPYRQSQRSDIYARYLSRLKEAGLTYPCFCTRADIMATQAPHQSDGRIVYAGSCRPASYPPFHRQVLPPDTRAATRLYVPPEVISFTDRIFGPQTCLLTEICGDFVVQRADGAWAYQLAVVVDDALMGITEVVRGCDLLPSTAQQIYLCRLLGFPVPAYIHLPLICNTSGQRLAKRDKSYSMEALRSAHSAAEVIGMAARLAGLLPSPISCRPDELLSIFDISRIQRRPSVTV